MERWSHYLFPKRTSLSDSLWEKTRWKVFFLYSEGVYITIRVILHLPWDSLTTLMTILLPYDFLTFTWLFIFCTCPLDFHFTIHFRIRIYLIHKIMWHMMTHDVTWRETNDIAMSNHILLLLVLCLLENDLFSTSICLRYEESSALSSL